MAGLPVGYTPLVGGADHHTRSRRYKEVGPEDPHIFWCSNSAIQGPQKPLHPSALKGYVSHRWPILPRHLAEVPTDDPGLCTGTSILGGGSQSPLPAPGEPCPLAMSIRELMWHLGKYTTFNDHDVFEGLGNALSGATVKTTQPSPMGTPLADSTASSAMTDIKDTQPSLIGTPLVNSTTSSAMTDVKDTSSVLQRLNQQMTPSLHCPCTNLKPRMRTGGLHWWMAPPFCWLNPKPGSRGTCQPPRVLALLDWKIQLPPYHIGG